MYKHKCFRQFIKYLLNLHPENLANKFAFLMMAKNAFVIILNVARLSNAIINY